MPKVRIMRFDASMRGEISVAAHLTTLFLVELIICLAHRVPEALLHVLWRVYGPNQFGVLICGSRRGGGGQCRGCK